MLWCISNISCWSRHLAWRQLAVIGMLASILQLLGLLFIPDSPRWLAKSGRWKECEASLKHLRGENVNISEEASEIRGYTETLQQLSESNLIDLFQRKYAHSFIVGVGLMVLQQFGGVNLIAYYSSLIFESADFCFRNMLGLLIGLSFLLQDLLQWKYCPVLALVGILSAEGTNLVNYTSVEEIGEEICENAKFSAIVGVENSEEMDGIHSVLLFIKPAKWTEGNPLKQLIGFQSVNLKAGGRSEVQFEINPCNHLSSANKDGLMVIEEESNLLVVGITEYAIDIVI